MGVLAFHGPTSHGPTRQSVNGPMCASAWCLTGGPRPSPTAVSPPPLSGSAPHLTARRTAVGGRISSFQARRRCTFTVRLSAGREVYPPLLERSHLNASWASDLTA